MMRLSRFWQHVFPELSRYKNDADRDLALESVIDKSRRYRIAYMFAFLALLLLGEPLVPQLLADWLATRIQLSSWARSVVETTVLALFAVLVLSLPVYLSQRQIQMLLRRDLSERGFPICLRCGYNLTGNVSGTCPECGTELEA